MKYEWSYFWLFVRHKPMPIFFNQRCKCFATLLARLHNVNGLYFIIVVDCWCTNFLYGTYLCISNLDVKVCLYLNSLKIYLVFASETLSTLSKNFFPSQDFFTQFGFHSNFHKYSWSQHTMAHFPSTVCVTLLLVWIGFEYDFCCFFGSMYVDVE